MRLGGARTASATGFFFFFFFLSPRPSRSPSSPTAGPASQGRGCGELVARASVHLTDPAACLPHLRRPGPARRGVSVQRDRPDQKPGAGGHLCHRCSLQQAQHKQRCARWPQRRERVVSAVLCCASPEQEASRKPPQLALKAQPPCASGHQPCLALARVRLGPGWTRRKGQALAQVQIAVASALASRHRACHG